MLQGSRKYKLRARCCRLFIITDVAQDTERPKDNPFSSRDTPLRPDCSSHRESHSTGMVHKRTHTIACDSENEELSKDESSNEWSSNSTCKNNLSGQDDAALVVSAMTLLSTKSSH